ncbi:MAG: SCO1664 family protein [Acidimicrobiales bacterium]|nr:SCO1664 family protein [Acidimicrobiales bacterium]
MAATGELLANGDVDLLGRMPWSSNATYLVSLCHGEQQARAVYKPLRGERPLWDFPRGLYQREVAAYELATALGWDLVPVTVARDDAPLGEGSLQHFVTADYDQHYFTLLDDEAHHDAFRKICVFDLLANNTDRKSGHVLLDDDGHIWAIDNGLSFHHEFKLRTVIWDFAGEPIPDPLLSAVEAFVESGLPDPLARWLDAFERDALLTRARAVLTARRFPVDPSGRRYPWPLV